MWVRWMNVVRSFLGEGGMPLRESRKRQPYLRETCGSPANANRISVRLAGVPQTPTSFPWHLQHSCKLQNGGNGACRRGGTYKKPERTLFSAYHSGLTSAHLTKPTDGQRNGNYQLISYSVVSSTTVASVAPDFLRERRVRPEPLRPPAAVLSMLVL